MKRPTIITLKEACEYFDIDFETLNNFAEFGLYPVISVQEEISIETRQLDRLERIISLHRTLGINKEGIDIILYLRDEITSLQNQVAELQYEIEKNKSGMTADTVGTLKETGLLIEIDI